VALRSIQIQVRWRELDSKLPVDTCRRICHTDVDTRGDEASKREPLRSPTARADGEGRAEREPSIGGGPISRVQDIRLDKRTNGVSGYLPCLGEQRGCLPGRQHKREKVGRVSSFFRPLPCKCHRYVCASRSRRVRHFDPIVSHCPLKTALTPLSSRRSSFSSISNVNVSSKCHGNLSCLLRQPPLMSISLEIVPITRRLELEGEPDGS